MAGHSIERRIRLHQQTWVLHPWYECPDPERCLRFHDKEATLLWLLQFKANSMAMGTLRRLVTEDEALYLQWRLKEDHFLGHLAEVLSRGEWHVCATDIEKAAQSSGGGSTSAPEDPPDNSSSRATKSPSPKESDDAETTWITIHLVDDDHKPVARAKYRVILPDQTVEEGVLDEKGTAHIEGITPGQCQITFPEIDGREWMPH